MYTSVGWLVLGPSYFSQDVVFYGSFYRYYLFAAAFCGVRANNEKETATHMHRQLATPVALDYRVDPTSDPTSELVIYAVSGSKPKTGAVDLSAGAAIREDALSAAARVLMLQ